MLRKFQIELQEIARAIAAGTLDVKNIFAYVTQGGGKSSIAAIMNEALPNMRICWVVPRDTLREQGAQEYKSDASREIFGNSGELRPVRGAREPLDFGQGFVTTYQSISMAHESGGHDSIFVNELSRAEYILILDECHHLPLLESQDDEGKAFTRSILPLVAKAKIVIFATGSLYRGDNDQIAFVPHKSVKGRDVVDFGEREGWAFISYKRSDALHNKAILPIEFCFWSGSVSWVDGKGLHSLPDMRSAIYEQRSPALFSALRSNFAYRMLDKVIGDWQTYKRDVYPEAKLLIISPNIETAEEYLRHIRQWHLGARIAHSSVKGALSEISHFKGITFPACDVLITVAMCYEGLNVKEISHVACMTEIRSLPWIEQAISRANRVDKRKDKDGNDEVPKKIRGFVFVPDDNGMRSILDQIARDDPAGLINYSNTDVTPPVREEEEEGEKKKPRATPLESALIGEEIYLMDGVNLIPIEHRRRQDPTIDKMVSLPSDQSNLLSTELERLLRKRLNQFVGKYARHDTRVRIKTFVKIHELWGGKKLTDYREGQLKEILRWLGDKEVDPIKAA